MSGKFSVNKIVGEIKNAEIEEEIGVYKNVCYMDILGFKEKILKSNDDCEHYDNGKLLFQIKHIGDIVRRRIEIIDFSKKSQLKSLMISDSVYIFYQDSEFEDVLEIISLIFIYGIFSNLFYRGSISDEKMNHPSKNHEGLFIGVGIVKSYEMERDIARFPRIVISTTYDSEYLVTDDDGIRIFNIFKYISDKYDDFSPEFNSELNKYTIFAHCKMCDEYPKECLKKIIPNYLPDTFEEFIDNVRKKIDKHLEKENRAVPKIYSKYFELYNSSKEEKFNGKK
ncbi:MAG: hypothetical protein KQ78_01550 [Candidatus Izimaplasma bacterium HR2]|nr:MAG: hypothetical protein KQ78_01550 [Candidatus Izimaplasma bacterium HR2]